MNPVTVTEREHALMAHACQAGMVMALRAAAEDMRNSCSRIGGSVIDILDRDPQLSARLSTSDIGLVSDIMRDAITVFADLLDERANEVTAEHQQ